MNIYKSITHCTGFILATTLALSLSPASAGMFKWVDENGQIRYGDKIPAKYAKRRAETLNNQGVVVQVRTAQKTPKQLAEENRLAKIHDEEQRKREERAHKDRILLDTFTSENEMIVSRDGKIEAIEAVIRITKDRINKARARLLGQTRRAANMERSGRTVPEPLKQSIRETRIQISDNIEYIRNRNIDQQAIRDKFEIDIKRFRELKNGDINEGSKTTKTAAN